jgi:DNA (cytosine-5)-methyltransferase 3A
MLQEWKDIISKEVGIQPIKINSSLVSAQNRVRNYWTNIGPTQDMFGNLVPAIPQPKDRGITLKDILEDEVDEKYYLSEAAIERLKTRHKNFRPQINPEKTGALLSGNQSGKNTDPGTTYIAAMIGGTINNFEFKANKANNIDGNYFKGADNHGQRTVILNTGSIGGRVYDSENKSTTINASNGGQGAKTGLYKIKNRIRRLTPIECERLMGVPDNYSNHVSDLQRYKMLGNGWQIDTIAHIFSFIKTNIIKAPMQNQKN